ncbi:hypothetical protein [Bosea vestrisii]|uniref:Uncharacterized protein n=1 Tax=Bosea vestrisii TaxID=151416 RepID=A0ABW0HFA2_9HYPH
MKLAQDASRSQPCFDRFSGDALEPHASTPLLLDHAERMVQPGYHVTELKAGA